MGARVVVVVTFLLAAAGAQAQPAPLPLLDVPFVSQSEALCGGAAAAMVLRYWGERGVNAESFAPLVDQSAAGIRTGALVAELARRGWQATAVAGTPELVSAELSNGRPVMALIQDRPGVFHYVVLVGATDRMVIFHDPARAPLRVMARDEFERRWRATGRWMAIVLPGARDAGVREVPAPRAVVGSTCADRIASGVMQAQAGDLAGAGQTLTAALSCPGAGAARELAGVRLLERRWDEVAQLAADAATIDPSDAYAWRLLGTSRFVLDQPLAALDAWNRAGEPRLDLIRVDGLERTRQRPVERLLAAAPGRLVSARMFIRADRALGELPSARSTRLELVPAPQGLVELHAVVAERPLVPSDPWSLAALAGRAAITRTIGVTLGSLTGGGESLTLEGRVWPERPRVAVSVRAPARWSGTWGADLVAERQALDDDRPDRRRRGGRLVAGAWLSDVVRLEARGGADRWNDVGLAASAGGGIAIVSRSERLALRVGGDAWGGPARFGAASGALTLSSAPRTRLSNEVPLGASWLGIVGTSAVSRGAPLDLWPGGDTGLARPILLRAHPILDDGRLRVSRLGRMVAFASAEAQYWRTAPALSRVGGALFVDLARTARRTGEAGPLADLDVGAGLRLASALVPGRFHLDYAHGVRDGADVVSLRYVTAAW